MPDPRSRLAGAIDPLRRAPDTLTLAFGGARLGLEWEEAAIGEAVELLFADLPPDPAAGAPPRTLRLEARADGEGYRLRGGDASWRGRSLAGLTGAVLEEALRDLTDRSRGGAILHAAAAARAGRTVVVPGESGSGKTLLAAWLLTRGFGYLTDELVYLESSSGRTLGFPRPLHVKRSGIDAFGRLLQPGDLDRARATPGGWLIPHRLLNPVFRHQTPGIGLVLLPRFEPSAASARLTPVSRADAGRRLMACLLNVRNLVGHGFEEVTRLTRSTDAYALAYGGFDQLGPALDPLLDRYFGS